MNKFEEIFKCGLKRQYSMSLSQTEMNQLIDKELIEFAKTADMPGFRKGKAPINLVRTNYQKSIEKKILNKVVISSMDQLNEELRSKPILNEPKIEIESNKDEEGGYNISLSLELFPTIPKLNLDDIVLYKPVIENLDDIIDHFMKIWEETLCYETQTKEGYLACEGDQVHLKTYKKNKAPKKDIEIDTYLAIATLEAKDSLPSLVGAKVGDVITPEGSNLEMVEENSSDNDDADGSNSNIYAVVDNIIQTTPVKSLEEYAENNGFKNVDDLRKHQIDEYIKTFDRISNQFLRARLIKYLDKHLNFDVPQTEVEFETNRFNKFDKRIIDYLYDAEDKIMMKIDGNLETFMNSEEIDYWKKEYFENSSSPFFKFASQEKFKELQLNTDSKNTNDNKNNISYDTMCKTIASRLVARSYFFRDYAKNQNIRDEFEPLEFFTKINENLYTSIERSMAIFAFTYNKFYRSHLVKVLYEDKAIEHMLQNIMIEDELIKFDDYLPMGNYCSFYATYNNWLLEVDQLLTNQSKDIH